MKNINYSNLVQNIIRCMFVYPVFFALFILSIPSNLLIWLMMALDLVGHTVSFVIHGKFHFHDTMIYDLFFVCEHPIKWFEIIGGLCMLSWFVVEKFLDFNSTLRPIR